ncbi:5-(carboxyamino)imidazole ribonucleotide synthase [Cytophagales bacterium LB-30]|uniref:N5-carboxyaminoimidazole ribonucleotide synthase n=1 Tax=Shiella aurantiaca TaxID=3058365 RepID=A0ABT8F5T5_9BACT|nr:5-(carboxyamino)imidazole ribonucleotide synthase [Shiella aurantiaca]MDN4165832.1 5-(carboxyamino)imidazole ribonucleotide synthase [Shiella aurantiaca]
MNINRKLGVFGGGQLGRMLIQSAINFNWEVRTLDPDAQAPCRNISHFTQGALKDYQTVYEFGKSCDVLTIEIEAVNVEALKQLEKEGVKVFPQPHIIELIQDKRLQKQFYRQEQIPTADFVLTENREELMRYQDWLPAVHKLGKDGYDGRGVQILRSVEDLSKGFDAPGVLERMIPFEKELAVIVARNESGEVKAFPAVEMAFHPEHNLVEYLFAPAEISQATEVKAQEIAQTIISKLGMVGLLAVEMFLTKEGEILVNEIAPRPHNSGHHTIEANQVSQYEQHLRAIMNLPLGDTEALSPAAMVNVLGEAGFSGEARYEGLEEILQLKGVHLHLYGKTLTKPFRKMGHITITDQSVESLKEKAQFVKKHFKVKA